MIEEYLKSHEIDLIRGALAQDESYDDFLTMGEIIAETRLNYRPESGMRRQAKFAFVTLCAFSWPGKVPEYKEEIRKLRRSFRGIYVNKILKEHFKARLTEELIAVERYQDLKFNDFNSIFHPTVPESRSAVMTASAGASSSVYDNEEDDLDDDQEK